MSAGQRAETTELRHVLTHLLTPLLMCLGMGLAYLGAFASPAPHHLPVAVVGSGPSATALARTLGQDAGQALDVRTVPDRQAAVTALMHRDIAGAYLPGRAPQLLVASAGSDTDATAVEKVFTPLASAQGAPLAVDDVAPPAPGDPTGQGLFFLLVAVSIGSYASVAVLGGAGGTLPMRVRALLVVGVSFAVSLLGALFAGPLFHIVDHGLWGVWGMSWLYSAGILFVGVGLHTFLKRWTTLGVMVLFVMLNFTSSGGIFRPELQNGFFGGLHAFWNGAGFVEGARDLVYFGGHGLDRNLVTLALWLVVGLLTTALARFAEQRRARALTAAGDAEAAAEEEIEESVAV
ncbi:hypothetical protein GXW83_10305 [Streptacidiphilus sp. PB12-B1b]|uniref:hypothetical protein n=1 Tax=Streptacidiphilus sp. PB12-B1b TaxID=2705012 RepID=UPI0015FA928C|nr:hypothetical protein [Streptacidiphilus sp. PB12-B1b]QMU76069.1 hypothetical protein GXW83_10305 [Streptacidiphilus sp. PB12-B1b]